MIVFLKGRQLWRYVTGDIPKPVPGFVTDSDSSDGATLWTANIRNIIQAKFVLAEFFGNQPIKHKTHS
jgi:hypothetical protein